MRSELPFLMKTIIDVRKFGRNSSQQQNLEMPLEAIVSVSFLAITEETMNKLVVIMHFIYTLLRNYFVLVAYHLFCFRYHPINY